MTPSQFLLKENTQTAHLKAEPNKWKCSYLVVHLYNCNLLITCVSGSKWTDDTTSSMFVLKSCILNTYKALQIPARTKANGCLHCGSTLSAEPYYSQGEFP